MVKREWYLLWHRVRHHALMKTKLDKILFIAEADISHERVDRMLERTRLTLESRKTQVLIEILPMYNRELSRILYAFSCFEKEVAYDADRNLYTVKVCLLGEEIEYLLSKLRFWANGSEFWKGITSKSGWWKLRRRRWSGMGKQVREKKFK